MSILNDEDLVLPAKKEIRMGNIVKDALTGFSGYAVAKDVFLTGLIQWALQPQMEVGKTEIPEAKYVDEHMLEILDEGIANRLPAVDGNVTIKLGEQVRDEASGLSGIAVEKITFHNGCVYFLVQPKVKKKDATELPEKILVDHKRLKRTGQGLAKKATAPKKTKAQRSKVPGGPMKSASSIRMA